MKKESKDIDEFFKENLNSEKGVYNFNQNNWDVLEQMLQRRKNRRHQYVLLFRTLVGTAAVLLIFFSLWMIKVNDHTPPETISIIHKPKEQVKKNTDQVLHPNKRFANGAKNTDNRAFPPLNQITKPSLTEPQLNDNQSFDNTPLQLHHEIKLIVIEPSQNHHKEIKSRKNIVLSVLAASALNGVNGFKNGQVGRDFGFLVSYDITKKLSISTGAVYAKKMYDTDFNRYIYPGIGLYEYGTKTFPNSVYADCRVLDIPLNVNYSLLDKGKNKVTIGTGLSSYIMLKEKYKFEYAEQHTPNTEKLELTNKNKHFMGVLNFQASYSRKLNSKVSIGMQPYLKIPLVDIGYAQAKLQSVGVAVNINFNLSNGGKQ